MGYKTIQLTKGRFTKVDVKDYKWLNQWKWCVILGKRTEYVTRGIWNSKTRKVKGITMHRLIMNFPQELQVDHINGDGLDNRRCNLRLATRIQQCQNRPLRLDNKSGYKGVYWCVQPGNRKPFWRSQIKVNGKRLSLGGFQNKEDAHLAYIEASKKYYGEYERK